MKRFNYLLLLIFLLFGNKLHALRLLFMVIGFPYTCQMYVLNQIAGMKDRGHEVTIVSQKKRLEPWPKILEPYDMQDDVYYERLPEGKRSFDVILCQFAELDEWWYQLKRQGLQGKTIVFCRGWDVSALLRRNPRRYSDFFNETDWWLPVCNYFKHMLAKYGYRGNKIQLLGSSIDCKKFRRSRAPVKSEYIRCTTVARLIPKKGIDIALRAIAQLTPHYHIKYTIVGEGKDRYKKQLINLVLRLGIEKQVSFIGRKSHEEIIELLHDTDIYIQPSLTDGSHNQEGIPNTIKEAMAMALPVISTKHAGIPEVMVHEESGLLVPEKNVIALRDAMKRVINDSSLRKKISMAAREQVLCYDIDNINDQLHCMLEKLCG